MFWLYVIALFAFWLTINRFFRRWKYDLHKIPSAPGFPVIGNTMALIKAKDVSVVLRKWNSELGFPKALKYTLLGKTFVAISDADAFKNEVMSMRDPLPKSMTAAKLVSNFFGDDKEAGALTSRLTSDDYVRAFRKMFLSSLSTKNLQSLLPTVDSSMDKMLAIIDERSKDGPVDFQDILVDTALDTIGVILLGCNLGGLDGTGKIRQLITEVGLMSIDQIKNPLLALHLSLFPNSERARRFKQIKKELAETWTKLADEIIARDPPTDGTTPFWYRLRTMIDPETGEPMSIDRMRHEIALSILAGMDTAAHQIGWILLILATHPKASEKLYEEVKDLDTPTIQLETLGSLPYVDATIKEAMRVCNVVQGLLRRVTHKDMTIMGYRLPKGTNIVMQSNKASDCEQDWGDPAAFRPERWIEDKSCYDKYFYGFSVGPRDCVGQRLAMLEMRLALVKLFQKYKFVSKKGYPEIFDSCKNNIVLESEDGMWLTVVPRET